MVYLFEFKKLNLLPYIIPLQTILSENIEGKEML